MNTDLMVEIKLYRVNPKDSKWWHKLIPRYKPKFSTLMYREIFPARNEAAASFEQHGGIVIGENERFIGYEYKPYIGYIRVPY